MKLMLGHPILNELFIPWKCRNVFSSLKELIALVRAGKVRPMPVETVSFNGINDALDRLRAGKVQGRLVIAR